MRTTAVQLGLFSRAARAALSIDQAARVVRTDLDDGAWVEHHSRWLLGDAELFDHLLRSAPWRDEERVMYGKSVVVPRRVATLVETPPIIECMRTLLDARYAESFVRTSAAHYRDGQDSVAWHGDYVARSLPEALVATVSLGGSRRFLVRPKAGGPSRAFTLEGGDLLVMGGTCQRTYDHAIPKVAQAEPRIALMFRPVW